MFKKLNALIALSLLFHATNGVAQASETQVEKIFTELRAQNFAVVGAKAELANARLVLAKDSHDLKKIAFADATLKFEGAEKKMSELKGGLSKLSPAAMQEFAQFLHTRTQFFRKLKIAAETPGNSIANPADIPAELSLLEDLTIAFKANVKKKPSLREQLGAIELDPLPTKQTKHTGGSRAADLPDFQPEN